MSGVSDFLIMFKKQFYLSVLCVFISSATLLLIPVVTTGEILSYIVGALFWLGFLCSQCLLWLANSKRKRIERKVKSKGQKIDSTSYGIVSFFRNKEAFVSDVLLFVVAVEFAALAILGVNRKWLVVISFAVLFVLLNLHCILNGRNYRCIKNLNTYEKYFLDMETDENE